MKRFPDPVQLPSSISEARTERKKDVVRAALLGIGLRVSIIIFEMIGVMIFRSSSLLMDALSSIFDVVSSIVLIFCLKIAVKPPDEDHPFGHGRVEPLAGFQLAIILIIFGMIMAFQQSFELVDADSTQKMGKWAWLFPFGAMVFLELSYRMIIKIAKKQNSPALKAEALHYRIDAGISFFVVITLLAAVYIPIWSDAIDHMGAILISILLILIGLLSAKGNLNQLMDRTPDEKYFKLVRDASKKVEGVKETEKIRIQHYGPDAHISIDVEVDPSMSVDDAHLISQKVRAAIQKKWPSVRDVTVHIEPFYANDH